MEVCKIGRIPKTVIERNLTCDKIHDPNSPMKVLEIDRENKPSHFGSCA